MKLPENVNWLIIQACNFKKIDYNSIFDKSQKREIVEARYIVMYILYRYSKESVTEIGWYFNKDHATVDHAKKTIENLYSTQKNIKYFIDCIELQYVELFRVDKINDEIFKRRDIATYKRHKLLTLDIVNDSCKDEVLNISIARALVCH